MAGIIAGCDDERPVDIEAFAGYRVFAFCKGIKSVVDGVIEKFLTTGAGSRGGSDLRSLIR